MRGVTLRRIAEATGFSVNTVSRALNDRPEINFQTKKKILAVAQELGYSPNRLAQGLRQRRSRIIGVVVTDIVNPFFGAVVKSIAESSKAMGYGIILLDTSERVDLEEEAVRLLISQRVDGVIICPVQQGGRSLSLLEKHEIPYVLMGRRFADGKSAYVMPDDHQAGLLAAGHLLELGHRRIALINAPAHISSAQERLSGFEAAHKQYNVRVHRALIRSGALSVDEGYGLACDLLENHPETSGVVSFSDFVAFGVIRAALEKGYRVPDTLSVIGIDDTVFSSSYSLPLTTVRSPKEQLGAAAVAAMAQLIDHSKKETGMVHAILPMELVVRSTTAPPSRERRAGGDATE